MGTMNADKYAKAMNPKMKGLFKGLRYISQIFEEEKEEEIQIGLPTDVKHVAHIGSDGPAHDGPSWMRDFKAGTQSPSKDDEDEDSKRGNKKAGSPGRDTEEVPRPSRHRRSSSEGNSAGDSSPKKKDPSSKSRPVRRSKDLSGSTQGNPPDIPKKSRRKKSKELVAGSGRPKSRASSGSINASIDGDPSKNDEE